VAILCYHTVEPGWTSRLSVEPERFDAHCRWLARHRTVVDLPTAVSLLDRRYRLPRGVVAITFDDGFSGVHEHAAPILRHHGLRATVFVVSDTLTPGGRPVDWVDEEPPRPLRTLRLDQLEELRADGFGIGSHSRSHHTLTELEPDECEADLRASREALEDLLHQPVPHLAYPRGLHDPGVRAAAARAGYELAFSLPQGPEATEPFAVPRVGVFGHNGDRTLRTKCTRWYGPVRRSHAWGVVDRARELSSTLGAR